MHDFLDKLGAAAKRAASNVANEVNVAAEKQRLSDCYRDLGKLCYQAAKRGETPNLSAEVAKIDEVLRRIAGLKDRRDVTNVEPEVPAEPVVTVEPKPEAVADEPDFVIVEE